MGAWGPGPMDNDGAWDFAAEFEKPIEDMLDSENIYYDQTRAAAEVAIALSKIYPFNGRLAAALSIGVQAMLEDKEYVKGWGVNAKCVRADLKRQIKELNKIAEGWEDFEDEDEEEENPNSSLPAKEKDDKKEKAN